MVDNIKFCQSESLQLKIASTCFPINRVNGVGTKTWRNSARQQKLISIKELANNTTMDYVSKVGIERNSYTGTV